MNENVVTKILDTYPKLETLCCAGTVSRKATREIIGIDRYEMNAIYYDLLEAEAVYGSGSNCFRATPALREFVATRRENREQK